MQHTRTNTTDWRGPDFILPLNLSLQASGSLAVNFALRSVSVARFLYIHGIKYRFNTNSYLHGLI